MRVLQVAHGFPPAAIGGAEIYARAVASGLEARADTAVAVLARESREDRPEFAHRVSREAGLDVHWVNHTYREGRSYRDTYRDPRMRAPLERAVDAVSPDVAHLHHLTNLSTELVDVLAERDIPIVFTLHDYWLLCHRGQLLDRSLRRCEGPRIDRCTACAGVSVSAPASAYRARRTLARLLEHIPARLRAGALGMLEAASASASGGSDELASREREIRRCLEKVSLFLSPSQTLRGRFIAHGLPPDRIRLHPYGHDAARFSGAERTRTKRLRIGFIGTLMASKAPALVLEAFARLPVGSASLRLHGDYAPYHGDDSYRATLDRWLARSEDARWVGRVDPEGIPAVLSHLDVLVVPSVWIENAPLTISEAFLAGVPVVCSDIGGMAEMVEDGVDGLHFRAGDATDLASVLGRLLADPELLTRLRGNLPAVRGIEDDVEALRGLYGKLA